MKIGISSDWHISQFSSIVRSFGKKHSTRLEHLINSINWAEELFENNGCYAHICLGDAFDKSELNAAEISALKDIEWGKMLHYFVVGNHEMASSDLSKNSTNLFKLMPHCNVIYKPSMLTFDNVFVFVLPYILNANRKELKEYINPYNVKPDVILSHNDLAGIQMGQFISKEGFSIEEIKENCSLFINGHLHNGAKIDDGIYNIGNLCGQNFSEDAFNYSHNVWILDTDTKEIKTFENPYSFNFYKIDCSNDDESSIEIKLNSLKNNAVVTIKCKVDKYNFVKTLLSKISNVIESRVIVEYENETNSENIVESLSIDHLNQFEKYIKEKFEFSDVLIQELSEVLK